MRRILIAAVVGIAVVAAACPARGRNKRADEKLNRRRSENMERKFKHFLDEENVAFGKKLQSAHDEPGRGECQGKAQQSACETQVRPSRHPNFIFKKKTAKKLRIIWF